MMSDAYCSVCHRSVNEESAGILTMGGMGYPRYLCPECERNLEIAGSSKEPKEIEEACATVSENIIKINTPDTLVINTVKKILDEAKSRAQQIQDGTYDFSLDEEAGEDAPEDIPEELLETEEERLAQEAQDEANKKVDKIISWISGIAIGAALIFLIIRFFIL